MKRFFLRKVGLYKNRYDSIENNDFIYFSAIVGSVVNNFEVVILGIIFQDEMSPQFKKQLLDLMRQSISSFETFDSKQRGETLPIELLSFSRKYENFVESFDNYLPEPSKNNSTKPNLSARGPKIKVPQWITDYSKELKEVILLILDISEEKNLGIQLHSGKRILKSIKFIEDRTFS